MHRNDRDWAPAATRQRAEWCFRHSHCVVSHSGLEWQGGRPNVKVVIRETLRTQRRRTRHLSALGKGTHVSTGTSTDKASPDTRHAGAQKVFFACFTERGDAPMLEIETVLPEHKKWVADQEAAGKIFMAGPFLNDDYSYAGQGLLLFRVDTAEDARRLAEADPMHAKGIRTFRIVPWQLNEGSMSIELNLLTGAFTFR
jgi:uncharacterized protein YciI